jgi:hypothetical protein
MNKANLLIIGAGRSGTTSLYHYLKDHKDICFSDIKEVHYFSLKDLFQRGENYFHSYFSNCKQEKIIAGADTYLLIDKEAPQRILSYNPEMKFIVLLREPVDRAYSSYHYAINNGYETPKINFIQSLELEKDRLKNSDIIQLNNLCHFYGGLYYEHLSYWIEYFPKENFLLLTTDELKKNALGTFNKISTFLQITPFSKAEEIKEFNKAAPVKSKSIQQFLLNRNHPLRNVLRPFIKPLKFIIINSGIINLLYKINKKEKGYIAITKEEKRIASEYYKKDLSKLTEQFNLSF